MNEYLIALIYIGLGIVGANMHFLKKRYVDLTTKDSLYMYLTENFASTVYTLCGIAMAEVNMALMQTNAPFALANVIGALTVGYTADSAINRSSEAESVASAVNFINQEKNR